MSANQELTWCSWETLLAVGMFYFTMFFGIVSPSLNAKIHQGNLVSLSRRIEGVHSEIT